MQRLLSIFLITSGLLMMAEIQANVTAASTASSGSVVYGRSASIPVTWNVTDTTSIGGLTTVSSTQGRFCLDTQVTCSVVLATNSKNLSQTYTSPASGFAPVNVSLTFSETLTVPAAVIYRAQKKAATSFVYVRSFVSTEGAGNSVTALLSVSIKSSSSGGFFISRISLHFDDHSSMRVVAPAEALGIQAEIGFSNTGLLRGVWEVADPTSTSGQPFFRPLRTVRQYLIGGESATLSGPVLPTNRNGLYLVRLRLTAPLPDFVLPVIQYFVSLPRPKSTSPIAAVKLIQPAHSAQLSSKLVFQWSAIRGSRAYQLEIYQAAGLPVSNQRFALKPGSRPVSGIIVPGKTTKTRLSFASLSHLQADTKYIWRIVAIGKRGKVIAESKFQRIRMP